MNMLRKLIKRLFLGRSCEGGHAWEDPGPYPQEGDVRTCLRGCGAQEIYTVLDDCVPGAWLPVYRKEKSTP